MRTILRKSGDAKQQPVATLGKFVRVVRTEHCFLLFEDLVKRDKWLQCLEVCFSQLFLPLNSDSFGIMLGNGVMGCWG